MRHTRLRFSIGLALSLFRTDDRRSRSAVTVARVGKRRRPARRLSLPAPPPREPASGIRALGPSIARRRKPLAFVGAVLMSICLVAPTWAATWNPYIAVRVGDDDGGGAIGVPGGLVTLGASTAVVMYADQSWPGHSGIAVRRSTNSGMTWQAPTVLSTETTGDMAIAGLGSHTDAVWVDKTSDADATEVRYARSADGGASFQPSVTFASPKVGYPRHVAVARGPNGKVAIGWTTRQGSWSALRVRVSSDGGATFGPRFVLATGQIRNVKLAIGDGVIYAVYIRRAADGSRSIEMRRSLDAGAKWKPATRLSANVFNGWFIDVDTAPTITAKGKRVYVGYVSSKSELWYRRSLDRGRTWSPPMRLATRLRTVRAEMSSQGGVVRVAYGRCANRGCWADDIRYRESADGITWSPPEDVAYSDVGNWVAGVGYAGKNIVLYMHPPDGSGGSFGTYVAVETP